MYRTKHCGVRGKAKSDHKESNWFAISQSDSFDEEFYISTLKEVDDELLDSNYQLSSLKKEYQLDDDIGPCQSSIDKTLKELGVERQAYFGGCIVGNHCDKLLKEGNIDIHRCSLIYMMIQTNLPSMPELYQNAIIQCGR